MRVHRNLHKRCWSIKASGKAPVVHATATAMRAVRFVVSEGGHKRVVEAGVRAVHAWAEGLPCEMPADLGGFVEVVYNPFRSNRFTRRDSGAVVLVASVVVFTADNKCLAKLEG